MALQSMTALASITLQEASASVTFSGIPQSYRDLIAVYNGTNTTGGDFYMTLNGDGTNSNYSMVRMATIPTVNSQAEATREIGLARTGRTAITIQLMDYSVTNKHKVTITRSDGPDVVVAAYASRWANTAAVTSVGFMVNGGHNFTAGSTFNLYGRIA
jgi:hypothetical protein